MRQFVGFDAGVVLDDARFFAGAANDFAFIEHVVGAFLRVGDDVVRAVFRRREALGDFLLGLFQGGVGTHLGAVTRFMAVVSALFMMRERSLYIFMPYCTASGRFFSISSMMRRHLSAS